ncbi:MAG TPA: hypothetical protein PKK74_01805 [Candidatus Methanoculleus thermohydrogenotrophicum]|jgi:hypothetical protein|nr:hypothetical protein [Candidatus Methanoculleus thermohydrogenotrophicum]NLM82526.1 hypothetical protein [Candidatus Methanoculleus thermohydrogenotrophicum]HOB17420.1 hypothetical protein [Candidatus Methanoculleus thermohydrogenotrophicum]HPZ37592.1 hypothetical protein [Candidatus Methanoculleus thermohydrogenotrophicum]HQC90668.1 hypothetical protein [Candidatus Methanoculleus thermohydrogenotrophicum]
MTVDNLRLVQAFLPDLWNRAVTTLQVNGSGSATFKIRFDLTVEGRPGQGATATRMK